MGNYMIIFIEEDSFDYIKMNFSGVLFSFKVVIDLFCIKEKLDILIEGYLKFLDMNKGES